MRTHIKHPGYSPHNWTEKGGGGGGGAARVLEIRISQIRGWLGTGVYRELGTHEIRLKLAQTHTNTHY